ncbi:ATP-dependent RNA helicase DED1 [Neolecta irregularis DAH-3]|uniref:RNA helicase n=1 Tax=Neolecta irregularis (strain DAH-3) TaxID=1198029 RepID=A0A1U7LVB5_NEOID|nr:ATP-dependent RNA helicase DED1 [Neolecta irregularis DAH-3]|eukprot:OLL26584.1 ATP-dependent RNA helicase DED1 [Neolecta irregularis DAH-3]
MAHVTTKPEWDHKDTAFDYDRYTQGSEESQWAHSARKFEWKEEYGDVAPRDEELEMELFDQEKASAGINFPKYDEVKGQIDSVEEILPINDFEEANLHPVMLENVRLSGYTSATPIQRYSIPVIMQGEDLIACAETGSGKTAAFLVPILRKPRPRADERRYRAEPLVLIVSPTRELSTQIFDESRKFCYRNHSCVYGGADIRSQSAELARGCDLLVATPGRLIDFLDRNFISLQRVRYVVLDEADRMLDMGFEHNIRRIIKQSDLNNDDTLQTLMFSATFPKAVQMLARDFLADGFIFVKVGRVGHATANIMQRIEYVENEDKKEKILELLLDQPPARTLVFVASRRAADSLDAFLYTKGLPTTNRTQREREDALIAFRNGNAYLALLSNTDIRPILIATDVAARGLDIKQCMHVINYDMPVKISEYVHRIGRTGRVGNKGLATSFYNSRDYRIARNLANILVESGMEIPAFLEQFKPKGEIDWEEEEDEVNIGYGVLPFQPENDKD